MMSYEGNPFGHKLVIEGLEIPDGERVGLLFYTGRLIFAKYNHGNHSIIWEDDGHESPIHPDYIADISRWLRAPKESGFGFDKINF